MWELLLQGKKERNKMDWNLFWNAFGAIGGTLGAIATFIAVIVALWQTKYEQKKKLKLSFSDNINVISDNGSISKKYVGVSVSNVGNRQVILKNWGILVDDKSKYVIIPDNSPIGKMIEPKLPEKLDIEEQKDLLYQYDLFLKLVNNILEKGQINKNEEISFFVEDSTGKKYIVKTTKKAIEYIK